VVTLPAENQARGEAPTVAQLQQTVEALAAAIEHWVREQTDRLSTPQSRTDAKIAGRAALRDLVAQADDLAAVLRDMRALIVLDEDGAAEAIRMEDWGPVWVRGSEVLARLDGARREKPEGWPDKCANCGASWEQIGYDHADGFNCQACGACDSDE
jgi:hypothetical protein